MSRRILPSFGTLLHASRPSRPRLAPPPVLKPSVATRQRFDHLCHPRAMMSYLPAAPRLPTKPKTYLDDPPDALGMGPEWFDKLTSKNLWLESCDPVWGFAIYRCSDKHEDAWNRLLETIRAEMTQTLEYYIRDDLIKSHDLHVIDDQSLYGASHYEVREHFKAWVPVDIARRIKLVILDSQRAKCSHSMKSMPRYEHCLFADDICLESMDRPEVHEPVVKILWRLWESHIPLEQRDKPVAPWHDGITEHDEEDVGWMYMYLNDYVEKYHLLNKWHWDDMYVRPPFIDGFEKEGRMVGDWRQKPLAQD